MDAITKQHLQELSDWLWQKGPFPLTDEERKLVDAVKRNSNGLAGSIQIGQKAVNNSFAWKYGKHQLKVSDLALSMYFPHLVDRQSLENTSPLPF